MSTNTMLILIGGRSAVPTISGALQFLDKISRIKFLVCEGEEYENLQRITAKVIRDKSKNISFEAERDVKIVNPSDFTQILKALAELISEGEEISFASLASAPQAMSIASYLFLQGKFPTATIFTVSTDQASIIPLKENENVIPFDDKLNVEDYILACGHSIYQRNSVKSFAFQNSEQLKEIASFFVENIESVDPILSEIRSQAGQGSDYIKNICPVLLDTKFLEKGNLTKSLIIDLLEKLQSNSLIDKLSISSDISFRVNPKSYSFLKGDWLELFVYLQALECGFDSLEPAIEMSGYNGQIDLFCLHNSNALICECKTGKWDEGKNRKQAILKLRNIGEKLGGSYCTKILVTSRTTISDEVKQEAENSKILVFEGKDLFGLSKLLKQEMFEPTYGRR